MLLFVLRVFLWLFKGLFVGCLTDCFAYTVVLLSCLYLFLVVCLCLNFIVLLHLPPVWFPVVFCVYVCVNCLSVCFG